MSALITSALYGMRMSAWRQRANVFDIREWPLDARRSLARASGSVSMKVRPKVPLHLETANQDRIALRAGDYAGFLTDYDAAVAALVSLLPTAFVDRPFPGASTGEVRALEWLAKAAVREGLPHWLQAGPLVSHPPRICGRPAVSGQVLQRGGCWPTISPGLRRRPFGRGWPPRLRRIAGSRYRYP